MRHYPGMLRAGKRCRSFCRRSQKNKALRWLDGANRRAVAGSFVAARLVRHDVQGLFSHQFLSSPLLTLGHHVKACTNQATSFFLLAPRAYEAGRYTKLHSKQMQTRSHIPRKHKQNQTNLCSFASADRLRSHAQKRLHFCNLRYDAIAVRGFTAAPTAGIPH